MITNTTPSTAQMDIINEKLLDAEIPGFYALFTDEEAAIVGAFDDDAISEETAREIDSEVRSIIERAYTKVKDTLSSRNDLLVFVAKALLEKESIDGEDLRKMLKEYEEGGHGNQS